MPPQARVDTGSDPSPDGREGARTPLVGEALGELEREVQLAIECAREADAAARGV